MLYNLIGDFFVTLEKTPSLRRTNQQLKIAYGSFDAISADGTKKARTVAKDFSLRFHVNFHETFVPDASICSLRILIALAAKVPCN